MFVLSYEDSGEVSYGDPGYAGVLGVYSTEELALQAKKNVIGTPLQPQYPAWKDVVFKEHWLSIEEFMIDVNYLKD